MSNRLLTYSNCFSAFKGGIENLDNQIPTNGTEPIYVKYADEEGKKRQAPLNLNNNHHHHNNNNNHHHQHNNNNNNNPFQSHHQTTTPVLNGLQNLGKMKSTRGSGQNRYNPISAANYGYQFSNFAQNGSSAFEGLINGFQNSFMNAAAAQPNNGHHQNHHHHQHIGHNNNNSSNNNSNNHHHHNQSTRHNQHQHNNTGNIGGSGGGSLVNGLLNFDNHLGEKGGHIIYVYGIGPHASESDLYTLFQSIGKILRVNVIKNQKTGLGKGYGFVVFEHYEEACYAVQQMNGFFYNNRALQVAFKAFNKNQ